MKWTQRNKARIFTALVNSRRCLDFISVKSSFCRLFCLYFYFIFLFDFWDLYDDFHGFLRWSRNVYIYFIDVIQRNIIVKAFHSVSQPLLLFLIEHHILRSSRKWRFTYTSDAIQRRSIILVEYVLAESTATDTKRDCSHAFAFTRFAIQTNSEKRETFHKRSR